MDDIVNVAFDYIQEFQKKYIDDEDDLRELNAKINVLDIEKDANASDIKVDTRKDAYRAAMQELFGRIKLNPKKDTLEIINNDIFKAKVLGKLAIQESMLTKPGGGYISARIPDDIINVYHDSGYNPAEIIENATTWITPGSFIDPARRYKPTKPKTKLFPSIGEQITIENSIFENLGFPNLKFNAWMLPESKCMVVIAINGNGFLDIRDASFSSVSTHTPIDYYAGNEQKNQAINKQENTQEGRNEIKKYIIAKELSDFSQILFAIINMTRLHRDEDQARYSNCIFTTDYVVAARSRLMGLQACVQDHSPKLGKIGHRILIYLSQLDEDEANIQLRQSYLNACVTNNRKVKLDINRAIAGGFYLGADKIFVFDKLRELFKEILEKIDKATDLAEDVDTDMDPALYKDELVKYFVKTPINERLRVVSPLQSLFVNCPELEDDDIIFNSGLSFGSMIQKLITANKKGNTRRKTRGNNSNHEGGYKILRGGTLKQDGKAIDLSENTLLWDMRTKLNLHARPQDFEDFIFRIFNHFIYIREVPLDDRLIKYYREIDRIEKLPLVVFYNEYYEIKPSEGLGMLVQAANKSGLNVLAQGAELAKVTANAISEAKARQETRFNEASPPRKLRRLEFVTPAGAAGVGLAASGQSVPPTPAQDTQGLGNANAANAANSMSNNSSGIRGPPLVRRTEGGKYSRFRKTRKSRVLKARKTRKNKK